MKRAVVWGGAIAIAGIALVFCGRDRASESGSASRGDSVSPLLGKPAPPFRLPRLDGGLDSLESHRGKVVVLDFWATWCGPCRRSMPILDKIDREDADVVVLAINLGESEETIRSFVERMGLGSRMLLGDTETARAYGVRPIPMHVVIDRGGVVRDVQIGFSPRLDERMRGAIAPLKAAAP